MKRRLHIQLVALIAATCAIPATPAAGQETHIQVQDFDVVRSTEQAGAHPRVDLRMRFCNAGLTITDVTHDAPTQTAPSGGLRIRTAQPHGIPGNGIALRTIYIEGIPGANRAGDIYSRLVPGEPNLVDLVTVGGQAVTATGTYTGGGELYTARNTNVERDVFGCIGQARRAHLRDFTLKLPPGFLGNPLAVPACPTHLFLAGSCPPNTQIGHAFADAISDPADLIPVPTSVFRIQTMGLEPARLGTEAVPGFPPGPLVNLITVRTTGDYGIDSHQINLPKELGASTGRVRAINVVLCERVPCAESDPTVRRQDDDAPGGLLDPEPTRSGGLDGHHDQDHGV